MNETAYQQGYALGYDNIADDAVTAPRNASFMEGFARGQADLMAEKESLLREDLREQEREYRVVAGDRLIGRRDIEAYIDGLRTGYKNAVRHIDNHGLPTPKVTPETAEERIATVLAVMDGTLIRATRCHEHPGGHPMAFAEQWGEDNHLIRAILTGDHNHDPIRPVVVSRAFEFAALAHEDQQDKAGHPYIEHPLRVAERLSTEDEQAVAFLHDVVEDTNATLDDLRALFSERIVTAVEALTHRKNEPRETYVARVVAAGELPMRVKRADVRDNADPERLSLLDAVTRDRLTKKYELTAKLLGTTLDAIFDEFPA